MGIGSSATEQSPSIGRPNGIKHVGLIQGVFITASPLFAGIPLSLQALTALSCLLSGINGSRDRGRVVGDGFDH